MSLDIEKYKFDGINEQITVRTDRNNILLSSPEFRNDLDICPEWKEAWFGAKEHDCYDKVYGEGVTKYYLDGELVREVKNEG